MTRSPEPDVHSPSVKSEDSHALVDLYAEYVRPIAPFIPIGLFGIAFTTEEASLFEACIRLSVVSVSGQTNNDSPIYYALIRELLPKVTITERVVRAVCCLICFFPVDSSLVDLVIAKGSDVKVSRQLQYEKDYVSLDQVIAFTDTWIAFTSNQPRIPKFKVEEQPASEDFISKLFHITHLINSLLFLSGDKRGTLEFEAKLLKFSSTYPELTNCLESIGSSKEDCIIQLLYSSCALRYYHTLLGRKDVGLDYCGGIFNFLMVLCRSGILNLCHRRPTLLQQFVPLRFVLSSMIDISLRLWLQFQHLSSLESLFVFLKLLNETSQLKNLWEGLHLLGVNVSRAVQHMGHQILNENMTGYAVSNYWMFCDIRSMSLDIYLAPNSNEPANGTS